MLRIVNLGSCCNCLLKPGLWRFLQTTYDLQHGTIHAVHMVQPPTQLTQPHRNSPIPSVVISKSCWKGITPTNPYEPNSCSNLGGKAPWHPSSGGPMSATCGLLVPGDKVRHRTPDVCVPRYHWITSPLSITKGATGMCTLSTTVPSLIFK